MSECPLVHIPCGACGHEIRKDGTCGCGDNRHPIGKFQQTKLGRYADALNRLREIMGDFDCIEGVKTIHPKKIGDSEHKVRLDITDILRGVAAAEEKSE